MSTSPYRSHLGESAMLSPSQVRDRNRFSYPPKQLDPVGLDRVQKKKAPASLHTHLANVEQSNKVQYGSLLKQFRKLELQHEQTENRLRDANSELKKLRSLSHGQDKELSYCKRTIEHLGTTKTELEAKNKEQSQYIKRLEGKMEIGAATSTLSARNRNLQARSSKFKNERDNYKDMLHSAEHRIDALNSEIAVLKSALQMHAPAQGPDGDNVLYQISKSQHENAVLGLEVARSVQEAKNLSEQLNQAGTRIEELQIACERLHTENDSLQRKLSLQHQHSADMHRQIDQLKLEKESLLDRIQEEQGKHDALNTEMNQLVDENGRREQRLTTEIMEWTERYNGCQGEIHQLSSRLGTLEGGNNSLETAIIQERQKIIEGKALIAKQNTIVRELRDQVNTLHSDIDRLNEENLNLQSLLDEKEIEAEALGNQVASSRRERSRLEDMIASTDRERARDVLNASVEIEERSSRLDLAKQQVGDLRGELARVETELETVTIERDRLAEQVGGLEISLERVTKAKNLLQKTMLDQISTVRSQLSDATTMNDQLSSRAETAELENKNLAILLEQTRRSARGNAGNIDDDDLAGY